MKYREYRFTKFAELLNIVEIQTLPANARKHKDMDVWIAPDKDSSYSKICLIDSDVTFGTNMKSITEMLEAMA